MLRLLIKGITKKVAQAGAGHRLARLFCGMMGEGAKKQIKFRTERIKYAIMSL